MVLYLVCFFIRKKVLVKKKIIHKIPLPIANILLKTILFALKTIFVHCDTIQPVNYLILQKIISSCM